MVERAIAMLGRQGVAALLVCQQDRLGIGLDQPDRALAFGEQELAELFRRGVEIARIDREICDRPGRGVAWYRHDAADRDHLAEQAEAERFRPGE